MCAACVQLRYAAGMINRFKLYQQNVGTFNTITWIVMLGFLTWRQFSWSSVSTRIFMLSLFTLCLIAPLATMPICERYPSKASTVMRYFQFILIAFFVINLLNLYHFPGIVYLIFLPCLFFFFGWTFWFYSSSQIFTDRRVQAIHEQWMTEEENELRREIAAHQAGFEDAGQPQDEQDRMS